jgi:hypothetical protein
VQYAPGATAATRSGTLAEGGVKEYVLAAAAHQTMHVQTVGYSAPPHFTIRSPRGATWAEEPQASDVSIFTAQVVLSQDGEYVVTLSVPPAVGATRYDVTFTINNAGPPSTPSELPERVTFTSGATSAQRSGLLPSGPGVKHYVLLANAAQTMTVAMTSDSVPLGLTIVSPIGMRWIPEMTPANGGYRTAHTLTLPETGDYQVTLTKADHTPSTNYAAEFTIP